MRPQRKTIKRTILGIVLLSTAFLFLEIQPRLFFALRLASGFQPLEQDARVYYESGAEVFAGQISAALPGVIEDIERGQSLPFKSPFRVYVCASHESFTRRMGQSIDSPVRGAAFMRDVLISPKSLSFYGRDTHRETLAHELSHLHIGQHLGWLRRTKNVPNWFAEGIADWVADTGNEIITREEAIRGFLSGRHLVPDDRGKLPLPRQPRHYGLTWPYFHLQSRMFIEYLHEKDPDAFRGFVKSVLQGTKFAESFTAHYHYDLDVIWDEFLNHIKG